LPHITLIRHGQAGQRDHYDRLSELGVRQASTLGEHLRREGARFDRFIVGGLRRQRETAEAVMGALGDGAPEVDPRWSEFDLDGVFSGIVPQLAAADAGFRAEWAEIERRMASGDAEVHREWTPTDGRVVEAWINNRFQIEGESWLDFLARVRAAAASLASLPDEMEVAVFTSAAPVSVLVATLYGDSTPQRILSTAGLMWNASLSALDMRGGAVLLHQFNAIPHLSDATLRTVR